MYTLPVDHKIKVQVSYVDAHGNQAAVDGPVAWASSDEERLTAAVDPKDSTICEAIPVGPIGQAQLTATADVDIGAGVKPLITIFAISLVAGEAVSGGIQPIGDPEPIG
jgi:hypothetical protein